MMEDQHQKLQTVGWERTRGGRAACPWLIDLLTTKAIVYLRKSHGFVRANIIKLGLVI